MNSWSKACPKQSCRCRRTFVVYNADIKVDEITQANCFDVMIYTEVLIANLKDDPDQEFRSTLIQICRREARILYLRRDE